MIASEPLLTLYDTADMLAVSLKTVRRLVASGALAAVRVGHQIRISREALSNYLAGAR
jgi:excisionase family DNA binding protein